jgi:hypothetical protein
VRWRALGVGCALAACAAPAWGARAPVAIGVSEREFHLTAYRKTVTPGRVRLNVQNYGQDTTTSWYAGRAGTGWSAPTSGPVSTSR